MFTGVYLVGFLVVGVGDFVVSGVVWIGLMLSWFWFSMVVF